MREIVIQKGIPLPEKCCQRRGILTDVLRKMEVGDMIELTGKQARSARPCASSLGIKVAQRSSPDKSTIRIWRVA